MKRIPINNRILPDYTKGEECMNMVTHIVGVAFGIFILVACIMTAAANNNVWGIVSSAIYGFTLIALYCVSSIYHGLRPCIGKKIMQVIDHCTIYLLIAGTYTPILLSAVRPLYPTLAWVLFAAEWGLAILGASLNAIDLKKYSKFSMTCYIAMGWLVVVALKPTIEAMTWAGFWWLLAGGIAYTLGAVLYGLGKKKRYLHSIFHLFVIFGTILQAVAIIVYTL
jgi:hemolysin III